MKRRNKYNWKLVFKIMNFKIKDKTKQNYFLFNNLLWTLKNL